ncbi:MAG: PHP domain-containing protein [Verrucomicrobia bacterium]|nr:PHP domain-containing protein [Verrucomicrobiota bacterium]
MIDLHVHSTFSDGTLTPEELIQLAIDTGLNAIALTDHDTTNGIPRFLAAAEGSPVKAIPGVEISADSKHGALHILGYFVEPGSTALAEALHRIRESRDVRNREIFHNLNRLGLSLNWSEVEKYAGEDVMGRPHFAAAMVGKGYVKDKNTAFNKYLGRGKRAYAERYRPSPLECIDLIKSAGGVSVLAHPFTLELSPKQTRSLLSKLRSFGLEGLEVYYPAHDAHLTREFLNLARELDLVPTGGTDFHGEGSPDIKLGSGFGGLEVADETIALLEARRP